MINKASSLLHLILYIFYVGVDSLWSLRAGDISLYYHLHSRM
ncbi:hypothetical protein ECEC1736_1289 [Escherichia coli EC1736]|nr:hypothetical protein ECFDA505_1319 [Escherichia coli FDA505]EIN64665.1 hypothetical protein ECPA9_1455 [Escherichia coli PA9]EIO22337.1 hypothetical protein ECPA33_1320 [Escherichia coli PA33]EIP69251.1 hypothetical protein ECEC4448_1339 [Escherichia coli EC4448]EKI58403.1 hypothetical protein ECEC1735_1396 [Escherichia coli EC1735]EKI69570.1 hypothetical protein ECEC1736_1289 [Escherichia coli EC1736]EKI96367.1 hypothetical protein ECEC1849_1304 [Escherichia coli EC1849]EKJ16699.1 hypoth